MTFGASQLIPVLAGHPNREVAYDRSGRHRGDEAQGRLMRSLALVVAVVVVVLGVAAVVIPDIVIATGRHLVSRSGLYAAAAFRVGVGLVLILAARESRAPGIPPCDRSYSGRGGGRDAVLRRWKLRGRDSIGRQRTLRSFVSRGRCLFASAASSSLRFDPTVLSPLSDSR